MLETAVVVSIVQDLGKTGRLWRAWAQAGYCCWGMCVSKQRRGFDANIRIASAEQARLGSLLKV